MVCGGRWRAGGLAGLLGLWACGDADPPAEETSSATAVGSTAPASSRGGSTGSSGVVDETGSPGLPVPLVDAAQWTLDGAKDDPFVEERPADISCAFGWGLEAGVFEVSTDLCRYGAFAQPSLADVAAGDTVELVLLHDGLYAEEPSAAHLGLAIGAEIAWQQELSIPREAGIVRPSWVATVDAPAGTPVHFHLHNHGVNNYRLVTLTVTGG